MATRSAIVKYYGQEKCFKSIYCHFDGYPYGVGKNLKENYQDENKINQLIDYGSISVLHETIQDTAFYIRNYGEEKDGNECLIFKTNEVKKVLKQILASYIGIEYIYIFYKNEWLSYEINGRNTVNQITV